jgi:SAM-dependent methyltransferase
MTPSMLPYRGIDKAAGQHAARRCRREALATGTASRAPGSIVTVVTEQESQPSQAAYWSDEGGRRWAANIEQLERQIEALGDRLVEHAGAKAGDVVLDVGCGGGRTSAQMAGVVGAAGRILGIDVSDAILDVAKRRFAGLENLSFEQGDAEHMTLPAQAFDLIVSRFGIMFFEEPTVGFANLRAALKASGRLVFMCWRALEENPWMKLPAAAVFDVLGPPPPARPDAPGPFALADRARLGRILTAAGFTDIRMEPIDELVHWGDVETAMALLSQIGPVAAALKDASAEDRAAALNALSACLVDHSTPEGVVLPSAAFIVTAAPRPGD